jgi:16S rRNA (cytosine967-C5)-methyltransferase
MNTVTGKRPRLQPVRTQAAIVLTAVIVDGQSMDVALPAARERVASEDRGLLAELCYGCLREGETLQLFCRTLLQKPLPQKERIIESLLMVGLYQLRHLRVAPHTAVNLTVEAARHLDKPWAVKLVNAVLRHYQRRAGELDTLAAANAVTRLNHPQWLVSRLQTAWPDDAEAIFHANNRQGGMSIRVNRLQHDTALFRQQLSDADINSQFSAWAPAALRLEKAVSIDTLPGFAEGSCSVQDIAAQLCAPLLELSPGQRVLDACAAPGGKTCHMLEHEPDLSELVAVDQNATRLQRIAGNVTRLKLTVTLRCADASIATSWATDEVYDRILLDAPCSGTGVIRRHPDIKYLRRETDIPALAIRQRALLNTLWPLLKPGGILLYTTCSVLPDENEVVIATFMAAHSDAELYPITCEWGRTLTYGKQLLPGVEPDEDYDGFYFARVRKRTQLDPD